MTPTDTERVALHETTRHRYLNYALSVITARALPDVRDGLKPVQRRILYAMLHNLNLRPEKRYRKSAAVVGEVMAKYHPHGDNSIYDALVRMAQPFSLRHTLVDGQGNFGSMDGDNAAAMRYTECKLRPIAIELMDEIKQSTVDFRPTYDGQHQEPVVLPAQFPQLLVNGTEGIAVGMATRIPPHNLREIIDACVVYIDDPDADVEALCKKVKGPDFPTGGTILNTQEELQAIYETGSGPIRMRGRWNTEQQGRRHHVVITEVPFAVNKAMLVERIASHILNKSLPQVVDVRDESTDEVRIVLDLRKVDDAEAAMAYLFKHTPLECSYHVNLTCLVPGARDIAEPMRCDLRSMLRYWLDFRFETVRRRYEHELARLRERIHILLGFVKIFDNLDEAIRLIRSSEGKRDAADRLMVRFDLDDLQVTAILELQLYKLAKLEINDIREELATKLAEASRIEAILASDVELWAVVRRELLEIRQTYGDKRRTSLGTDEEAKVEYSETAYIVAETAHVIVTRDGWIKRQASFTDIDKIRIRDGDTIGWIGRASTRNTVTFYTDKGGAYVMRVDDVPQTTGYGEPVQRRFTFSDGERVVGVILNDPLALPPAPAGIEVPEGEPPPPYAIAVTKKGRAVRFATEIHSEVSTRTGRKYMRPADDRDAIFAVWLSDGTEQLSLASVEGRALCFPVMEVNLIRGAGKGVTALKLRPEDAIFAFELTRDRHLGARVTTPQGREEVVRPSKFAGTRAGRGRVVIKRGGFAAWVTDTVRYDIQFANTQLADASELDDAAEADTDEVVGAPGAVSPPTNGSHRPVQQLLLTPNHGEE